jgi:hypothetical protein
MPWNHLVRRHFWPLDYKAFRSLQRRLILQRHFVMVQLGGRGRDAATAR